MDLPYFVRLFVLTCLLGVAVTDNSYIDMTVEPTQKVQLGTSLTVTCAVDRSRKGNSILWKRQVGDVTVRIGTGATLNSDVTSPRYALKRLPKSPPTSTIDSYQLTIRDAKVEDISTIICELDNSVLFEKRTITVCDHTDSYSCNCIIDKGYLTHECYEEPANVANVRSRYKGAVIGLVVFLVIAILIGIVLALIVGRDWLRAVDAKRRNLMKTARENGANRRSPDRQQLDRDVDGATGTYEHPDVNSATSNIQSVDNPAYEVDVHSPAVLAATSATAMPTSSYHTKGSPPPSYKHYPTKSIPSAQSSTYDNAMDHRPNQQYSPAVVTPRSYNSQPYSPATPLYANSQQTNGGFSPRDVAYKSRPADVASLPTEGRTHRDYQPHPKQLEFNSAASYNASQDDNNGPYIDKTDMIV